MKFNKGSELDKQIYKEGEPTWGCKSGVLDVEDVKEFIKQRIERIRLIIKMYPHKQGEELAGELVEDLLSNAGEKLQ